MGYFSDPALLTLQHKERKRIDMQPNMGTIDRIARVVIALIIGYLYFANIVTGALAIILLVLALVFLATSIVGYCPLYWPFKLSTKRS